MDQAPGHLRQPQWTLAVLALLIVVLAAGVWRLHNDAGVDALAPSDPAATALADRVQARFGVAESIAIIYDGLLPGDALRAEVLAEIQAVSALLQTLPGLAPEQVMSLSTRTWTSFQDGTPRFHPLLPAAIDADRAAAVQRGLAAAPSYRGLLLSADARSATIFVEVAAAADAGRLLRQIERVLRDRPPPTGVTVRIGGQGALSGELSRRIDHDIRILLPAAMLLSLAFVAVLLRNWTAAVLGAATLGAAVLGTLGLMGWSGQPATVVTPALLVVIACAAIAGTLHLLVRAGRLQAEGLPPPAAIDTALSESIRPLSLTSLATAGGFLALASISTTPAVRALSGFAAAGIGWVWLLTVLGLPWAYAALARAWPAATAAREPGSEELMREFGQTAGRLPRSLLLLAATGLVLGLWGSSQLFEARVGDIAPAPLLHAAATDERLSRAPHCIDIYLQTSTGNLLEPQRLAAVTEVQAWMSGAGGFVGSRSYADPLREARLARDPQAAPLPATADEAERWQSLLEASNPMGTQAALLSRDRRVAVIRGVLRTDDPMQVPAQVAFLQQALQRRLAGSGVLAEVAGQPRAATPTTGLAPDSAYLDAAFAAAAVLVLAASSAALSLRSIRLGLLLLVPMIGVLLCAGGIVGAAHLRLDPLIPVVAVLAAGLAADSASHLLHAIDAARRQGRAGVALAEAAFDRVGVPLTFNALVLTGGLQVVAFSSNAAVVHFALLAAAAVLCAYLAACLILMPWMALLRPADLASGRGVPINRPQEPGR